MAASFIKTGKKIVAIGRNYAAHAKELNHTIPTEPFFFLKPTTSYVRSGGRVEIPRGTLVHHEVELGLVIGKRGKDIPQIEADKHIAGYALAVDMTARNMQDQARRERLPWSAAKGFDTFTPVGSFIPKQKIIQPHDLLLQLKVNGTIKQHGPTSDMIFQIPRLIEHISSIVTLEEGDLILTGTPQGVGPVEPGDKVECLLSHSSGEQLTSLDFDVVARNGGYQFQPEGQV